MLIDTNTQLGVWPFTFTPDRTAAELLKHLRASGISRALVSHLGAVFQPDPMPSNRTLFAAVKRTPALVPVPVVNLRLANWREQLEACVAAKAKAVKLLPNFHNYNLAAPAVDEFVATLAKTKLRLVINFRYEDERHRYFGLNVKGTPVADVQALLQRQPKLNPLLAGIYRPELKELAKACANFSAEISFCEWHNTLEDLLKVIPARRLMLGTCTPMLSTRGEVDKLRCAHLPVKTKALIGSANAIRFFKL
jgi:uncharacterized protein|uniref:amidohydrolase family protein n=1 Tax=Cephaloticoccus sp. TaxID=1985742 RepID=UPI00404A2DE9